MRRILRGPVEVEAIAAEVEEGEEEPPGTLQDSSDDEEDVNWKNLEEECIVEDLMDRYASGDSIDLHSIDDLFFFALLARRVAIHQPSS